MDTSRPAIPDTPLSPVVATKVPRLDVRGGGVSAGGGKSLLEMWSHHVSTEVARKQREFVGRVKAGPGVVAKLYAQMDNKMDTTSN